MMQTIKRVMSIMTGIMMISTAGFAGTEGEETMRLLAGQNYKEGNYQKAFDQYQLLCLDSDTDSEQVGGDLEMGIQCLLRLNRADEVDDFREKAVAVHPGNWRLLAAAAESYLTVDHNGFRIAGEFRRGRHRGGGEWINAFERDRTRALQLMDQARPLAASDDNPRKAGRFFLQFADMFLSRRDASGAWRLQYLTGLSELPDYEQGYGHGWGFRHGDDRGAPADADGNPVFHQLPESWASAASDGERWRWLLKQAGDIDNALRSESLQRRADFHFDQFGVQTMVRHLRATGVKNLDMEEGVFALHTLAETETIARLATGIKRFYLPDEFNFIRMYRELGNHRRLAEIFENRRQYPKAADLWQKAGEAGRANQILGNWGVFEPVMTQAPGKGATVEYRFRNGSQVRLTAHALRFRKLLADIRKEIESSPRDFNWQDENPGSIGFRIVQENETRYLGEKAAEWTVDLTPRPNHFDRRITLATPLQKAGAYLLEARMEDGNTSRIIIWLDDTVIVKKPLSGKTLYFVADAVTGAPVPEATLEFFGYRREWRNKVTGYRTTVDTFTRTADADGQVVIDVGKGRRGMNPELRWLVTVAGPGDRLAYLGFDHVWSGSRYDSRYSEQKVYVVTDRPVYRPGQTVKFKMWLRNPRYDEGDTSRFANNKVTVQIHNPKGEKVFDEGMTTDAWAGLDGELTLPEDAALGVYTLAIPNRGGGQFRVEEYKKPEFEVTVVGPEKPVKLGDKIEATITAKYYFGAPVVNAKIKYKVLRYAHHDRWFPPGPWDWLYGPGYGWLAEAHPWYPGWASWGCLRPLPWWIPFSPAPPEVVTENEVEIGPEGEVTVTLDTLPAAELHGDTDHRYEITAEVTDLSRRTIVGTGSVLAARQPFKVYVWTNRGHYRAGDTIQAHVSARTADGKPVTGKGRLRLLKINYDAEGKPTEQEAGTWEFDTGDTGDARLQLTAALAGQYRLAVTVTDAGDHSEEGAILFPVRGDGFQSADFRFNALEVIPDKATYAPGETARLMINTDRLDGTVLIFVRPLNGVYETPKVLRMKGKSLLQELEILKADMPNAFVEALTVANGRVHTEVREILVPPEKRVLNVEVVPDATRYQPGQDATVRVKLTDLSGNPFAGSTVLSVYDKAVEYISDGSNIPEIRAFFWKWRRSHHPSTFHSLGRMSHNMLKRGEIAMAHLGVFGHLVADMDADGDVLREGVLGGDVRMMKSAGRGLEAPPEPELALDAVPAPRMAMPAPMAESAETAPSRADKAQAEPEAAATAAPTVRTQFADTAFWAASLVTDKEGMATVTFPMPENLTGWKVKAWAMGHGTRVGEGSAEVVTAKNLMVRLQAPRFFVQKDEVVLSANIHNYLETDKPVQAVLEMDGPCLTLMEGAPTQTVSVDAGGETRVDWRVSVVREGEAVVRMKAITDEESDAMEMRFPVYVHGMDKMVPVCGVVRPEQAAARVTLTVPAERREEATRLAVRYSPTLAGAMVDALPYLVDYPYGCTEQTLNRFLPTVITQRVLLRLGVDLAEIAHKQTNLNAQEIGDARKRAEGWRRYKRNPVFDAAEVDRMVRTGVERLLNMQLSDGGWGWFSGWGEHSYPHTTALVVHGLMIARENGAPVDDAAISQGLNWLRNYQAEEVRKIENGRRDPKVRPWKSHADNLDALVYMVLTDGDMENAAMGDFLYEDRNHLSAYAKAIIGLAFEKTRQADRLAMILENIGQYLVTDDENQTAWLNLGNDGYWWYWYGSEIEAHAYYLKLLSRTDPKGETASRLVKYLLNNRKHATYWNSTRDTAICIEALADYLKASGEDRPDMTVEVLLDGKKMKEVRITPDTLFSFDDTLLLEGAAVTGGDHVLELRRRGKGPLYFNAYLSYFTLEDFIPKAGLEIKVDRAVYKLIPVDKTIKVSGSRGQALDQKVEKYERERLENLSLLKSGDLVEIELTLQSKNDYEYIVFEDMKAGGFEPVEVRSGYTADGMGAYMELRDEKVAFFVRWLARGTHSIAYRMRAEIPGKFSALPTTAYGMYAPELRGNSDEIKLRIAD